MTFSAEGDGRGADARGLRPAMRLRRNALITLARHEYGIVVAPDVAVAMLTAHQTISGSLAAIRPSLEARSNDGEGARLGKEGNRVSRIPSSWRATKPDEPPRPVWQPSVRIPKHAQTDDSGMTDISAQREERGDRNDGLRRRRAIGVLGIIAAAVTSAAYLLRVFVN
jgi:hypothetical protein